MNLVLSETIQTAAIVVVAFVVVMLIALVLKAESATWKMSEDKPS